MVRAPAPAWRWRARVRLGGVKLLVRVRVSFRAHFRAIYQVSFRVRFPVRFRVRFGSFRDLSRGLFRVIDAGLARQALTATLPGPSPAADCALAGVSEIRDSRCHRTAGSS